MEITSCTIYHFNALQRYCQSNFFQLLIKLFSLKLKRLGAQFDERMLALMSLLFYLYWICYLSKFNLYHGNYCVDSLWCCFFSTWPEMRNMIWKTLYSSWLPCHNAGSKIGNIECDTLQDTISCLTALFFKFWENLNFYHHMIKRKCTKLHIISLNSLVIYIKSLWNSLLVFTLTNNFPTEKLHSRLFSCFIKYQSNSSYILLKPEWKIHILWA